MRRHVAAYEHATKQCIGVHTCEYACVCAPVHAFVCPRVPTSVCARMSACEERDKDYFLG